MRSIKYAERMQIDALLTPEQQAKLKEMLEKRMHKHGKRGG